MQKTLWKKEILELEKQMKSLKKKTKKKKDYKLTRQDWLELLEFWPLSIFVPAVLIILILGVIFQV